MFHTKQDTMCRRFVFVQPFRRKTKQEQTNAWRNGGAEKVESAWVSVGGAGLGQSKSRKVNACYTYRKITSKYVCVPAFQQFKSHSSMLLI